MSTPKLTFSILSLLTALVFTSSAKAVLYGFNDSNPETQEEKILNMGIPPQEIPNYRDLMRQNISILAKYAKAQNPDFQIMLHEGEPLLEKSLWEYHLEGYNKARAKNINASDPSFLAKLKNFTISEKNNAGTRAESFRRQVDAVAFNNLYCSPRKIESNIKKLPLTFMGISYCPNVATFDAAAELSVQDHVPLYAFIQKSQAFKNILKQPIINENAHNIFKLSEAENISFLLDDSKYNNKFNMIKDIRNSNYDVVVINPLFHGKTPFFKEEIDSLKFKKNGARRLIIAEQNISEANSNAYYWQDTWEIDSPSWLRRNSFSSDNTIITEYWNEDWQKIISAYFKSIVFSDYDGVFFTGLENHQYFEKLTPLE